MNQIKQAIIEAYKQVPQTSDELMKDDAGLDHLRSLLPEDLRPTVEETRQQLLTIRKSGKLPRLNEKTVKKVELVQYREDGDNYVVALKVEGKDIEILLPKPSTSEGQATYDWTGIYQSGLKKPTLPFGLNLVTDGHYA